MIPVFAVFLIQTLVAQEFPEKINGVNLVSPVVEVDLSAIASIKGIHPNWVSICPWAFLRPGDARLYYNTADNYWGDRPDNLASMVEEVRRQGMNILLKPHVWVNGLGWSGDFDLNETGWYFWEINYSSFILDMARFAETHKIEMFCIGVELKTAVQKRPEFWKNLIEAVREVYSGKVFYAANWDNYQHITFWDRLDYIGVDAYFPLSNDKTPEVNKLIAKWRGSVKELEKMSVRFQKRVIFAEYGYRSIDRPAWNQWEVENISTDTRVNLQAQCNAYEALFESVWNETWFAGGFIWKWYLDKPAPGGSAHSGYTPQNKPVESIITKWYSK